MKKMKARKRKGRSVTENVRRPRKDELFGFLAGEVKIIGDIESPIFPAKRRKRIGSSPDRSLQSEVEKLSLSG